MLKVFLYVALIIELPKKVDSEVRGTPNFFLKIDVSVANPRVLQNNKFSGGGGNYSGFGVGNSGSIFIIGISSPSHMYFQLEFSINVND